MNSIILTNIQRMCMNDGPGIRTTVFFKGCNLTCPWCCNPENISFEKECYKKDNYSKVAFFGIYYDEEMLYDELLQDENFWKITGGGITFSGGEPLLQLYKIENVLRKLKKKKIHLTVETALHVSANYLYKIMQWIDFFIVDIKILDPQMCKEVLNGNMENYFQNLDILRRSQKALLFRIPCNMEYTIADKNLKQICKLLNKYSDIPVEIFSTHNLGKSKYDSLGKEYKTFKKLSEKQMLNIKARIEQYTKNKISIQSL